MARVLGILKARWFVTLVGAILVALLVWFVGPLIAFDVNPPEPPFRPLDSELVRLAVIFVVFVIWVLLNLRVELKRKRSAEALEKGLTAAAAADPDDNAPAEEVAILRERLAGALDTLRRSAVGTKAGRNFLYQLPWYVIIGPPGSGKTTALVNSGLRFPLAEQGAVEPVRGVGGTRHCDWWFSDEAVLLDTAGRYTTQDSNKAVDAAGWTGFLNLLKTTRPRQPINGAIVAISLSELMAGTEAQLQAHARAVKQRLRELRDELGVRFPVYVLFTKADLIAGFVEFHDDLDREDRQQVWGMSFDVDDGTSEGGAVARFGPEFDLLVERLNARVVERMQQESDIERRSLIHSFPVQFVSLKETADRFLTEIFRPSRLEPRFLLRGVYFTSGTQEGTPIDRVMGAMASTFGLDRQKLAAFRGGGRSYFITRLLREVIFAEAGLVNANRKVERRQKLIWYGTAAAMIVVLLGVGTAWAISYGRNRALVAEAEQAAAVARTQIEALPPVLPENPGLSAVLVPLDSLRALPAGYDRREESVPTGLTWGLYQGRVLGDQAVAAYYRGLNALLRPRLLARVEQQIRSSTGQPEYLFEALKAYLMLAGYGDLDRDLLRQWMRLDWNAAFPGAEERNVATREGLARHFDAMLERLPGTAEIDEGLVAHARLLLSRTPLPNRAYAMIRQSEASRTQPDWQLGQAAGQGADQVLRRRSGKPLGEGIPGLYTVEGYYRAFRPALANVIRSIASESWVLGPEQKVSIDPFELAKLQQNILDLYLDDYIRLWDELLKDLSIPSLGNLARGADLLNVMSSAGSPLKRAMVAIARQTTLTEPPTGSASDALGRASDAAAGQAAKMAAQQAATFDPQKRLTAVVGAAVGAPAGPPPEKRVDDHFRRLREFARGTGTGPAPIDDAFRGLDTLYQSVSALASAPPGGGPGGGGGGAPPKLRVDPSWPEPIAGMMDKIQDEASALTVGGSRAQLNGLWRSEYLPVCQRAVEGRYPFSRGSSSEVPIDDFARVFAPGGLLDNFFNTQLRGLVDMTGSSWRWRVVENVSLGTSASALTQFQRAALIRQAFFPAGSAQPMVRLVLTPESLDPDSTEVTLTIEGQAVTYNKAQPARQVAVQWPGPNAVGEVQALFMPPPEFLPAGITVRGPWALFRLLDQSRFVRETADQFRLTIAAGGRHATFGLRAGSVLNPFGLRELEAFRCPPAL